MSVSQNTTTNSYIIIVHPNYRQHRYLLSTFLSLNNVLYLRFDDDFELDWLSEASDYNFLILDEFDRLNPKQAATILDHILQTSPNSRIVLFSRHLPVLQPHHLQQAALFPIDADLGLVDYLQQPRTVIEFFALGSGAVAVNGNRKELWLEDTNPLLLFYLLEKGRASRSTLLEIFWSGIAPRTAIRALHNLKQRINDVLGFDVIVFQHSFYQLNPELELVYDVANYQRLVDAAYHAPPNLSTALFTQAHAAYKGDYLQGVQAPWAKTLRHALRKTQADAQARLGALYAEQAQKEQATTWYSFAFKHNPARDDVLFSLMKLFIDLKMPCDALEFYQRHAEVLREKHGISPHQHLQSLVASAKSDCQED